MTRPVLYLAATLLPLAASLAEEELSKPSRRGDQLALERLAGLVGSWKGTGQPQRTSVKGAWRESADWEWLLTMDSAALVLKVADGRLLRSATVQPGSAPTSFRLEAVLADGSKRSFAGVRGPRDGVVFTAVEAAEEGVQRITLTPLHDTRFLLLFEARHPQTGQFQRLAEVGYTRQGVAFAAGDSYPLCIVTGGRGTIKVSYQGKDYYVCCSGCKDLFDADPAGILAEAQAKSASSGGPPE